MSERDWSREIVVIIGAARQGIALARYLLEHGANVRITDLRPLESFTDAVQSLQAFSSAGKLEWSCGGHPLSLLDQTTMVCPSGGVPLTLELVREARRRGILLSNDSQIFLEEAPCRVIGITGSAGKTTTTTLVARMANVAARTPGSCIYRKAWVGGNIGSPLISLVVQMQPDDLAVMELSSFQLEIMTRSPQIAAILNITPNHLDRHDTMESYVAAKSQILAHQGRFDSAVLGRDDDVAWSLACSVQGLLYSFGFSDLLEGDSGAYLQDQMIYLRMLDAAAKTFKEQPVMSISSVSLRGNHNLLNVMASCTIAAVAGLPVEAMKAGVENFTGVPHRLEFVRSWGGASWYNDSIATAPERAMAAIRSFHEPLLLLAGGRDKKLPWDEFASLVCERVDHLIVFGEAADTILKAFPSNTGDRPLISRCKSLQEAVSRAAEVVRPGEVVLLSPGGTSFDEFIDFEERGKCFTRWVKELP
jgi:UDP-N-acetylmuramoylalanine--D-glutamate ligase